jgi:hypothetical protein
MKKSPKEVLFWHSPTSKLPTSGKVSLLCTNDGVFPGTWDHEIKRWRDPEGRIYNSDTRVVYWTNWPKGVPYEDWYK